MSSEASRRLVLQLLATANLGSVNGWVAASIIRPIREWNRHKPCDIVRPLISAQDHVQLRNALRALGLILDAKFHSIFGQDKAGGCATVDGGVMVETCGNMWKVMQ